MSGWSGQYTICTFACYFSSIFYGSPIFAGLDLKEMSRTLESTTDISFQCDLTFIDKFPKPHTTGQAYLCMIIVHLP